MKDSKITEVEIDKAREGYRSVAYRAAILFFCIVDLNGIDPMYEYSFGLGMGWGLVIIKFTFWPFKKLFLAIIPENPLK